MKVWPEKLHSIFVQVLFLPVCFPNPNPSGLCMLNTKWAVWRRPRPSSPWICKGMHRSKQRSPPVSRWKISWLGQTSRKFRQKAAMIAFSRTSCLWRSPCKMCKHEFLRKKSNQDCSRKIGIPGSFSRWDFSMSKDNWNRLTRTLWESLSGFDIPQCATSNKPPHFSAARWPISDTKSRAAAIAEVHEA